MHQHDINRLNLQMIEILKTYQFKSYAERCTIDPDPPSAGQTNTWLAKASGDSHGNLNSINSYSI